MREDGLARFVPADIGVIGMPAEAEKQASGSVQADKQSIRENRIIDG